MRVLVLGAGGVGGYYGGRLQEGGGDVTFLVRPRRRDQLQREGLRVESPLGGMNLQVKTVQASEVAPVFDLVLLTCKAYDLESAIEDVAPAVVGGAAVLPLLNGMTHFARLDERFGRERVLGGTCAIGTTLRADGVVVHSGTLQRLWFGERDGTRSARAQAVADLLAHTKIDWEWADDIRRSLWEKLVFLSALAATTCLFRANVGEIVAAPGGPETVERALRANVEIATREGCVPRAAVMDAYRAGLLDAGSTASSSMLRDLEAGGRVESDAVIGWMLAKAREHGVDDTVLALAYTHLKAYESRRARP